MEEPLSRVWRLTRWSPPVERSENDTQPTQRRNHPVLRSRRTGIGCLGGVMGTPSSGGIMTSALRTLVFAVNFAVTPSVTAVAHVAIATGSTAPHNDIPLNTFHPVASQIGTSISGFAAPIGGYQLSPLGPSPAPTAEPLWVQLRRAGKKVVTATWPGSDGADISISNSLPGTPAVSTLVQAATPTRITDYTVPFGAFGGLGAQGFALTSASFVAADATLTSQLL